MTAKSYILLLLYQTDLRHQIYKILNLSLTFITTDTDTSSELGTDTDNCCATTSTSIQFLLTNPYPNPILKSNNNN